LLQQARDFSMQKIRGLQSIAARVQIDSNITTGLGIPGNDGSIFIITKTKDDHEFLAFD
jgi:hypothetical protein